MHLVIPFAAPLSDEGRAVARGLQLPHLARWLKTLAPAGRDDGDEWSLSPPHERALARVWGWAPTGGRDGCLPWAALAAAADGIDTGDLAWALLSPVHWLLGTEQVSMLDPATLMLDDATSRNLFDTVAPLFTSEGFVLAWGAAPRWYAAHPSFAGLPTASLDRVIGRNVDRWLGSDPAARRLRRLQSEVQMQLHEHPLNTRREARGLLPVNSFWASGCGVAQPAAGEGVTLDDRLRAGALAGDWAAWAKAWETLDQGPLATTGSELTLTLCGERASATFGPGGLGFFQRFGASAQAWPRLMETL